MAATVWTLAKLTPEQERLLKEAEATLGGNAILVYSKDQAAPSELTPNQLETLQQLERKLGMPVVAVKPTQSPRQGISGNR